MNAKIVSKTPNGKHKNGNTSYDYVFEFPFKDRTSYVAYVAAWKERLKSYIHDVRESKKEAAAQKAAGQGYAASQINSSRRWGRHEAHVLMVERRAMKVEAQRQYLASRTAPVEQVVADPTVKA